MQISMGYSSEKGRLHTRYAPVRHSSAKSKLFLLPFDLHVLSLPLAFILSQDQTLHCNYNVKFCCLKFQVVLVLILSSILQRTLILITNNIV